MILKALLTLAWFLITLPAAIICPYCTMIGIINPLLKSRDIALSDRKNACYSTERNIRSCCNKEIADRIKLCWNKVAKEALTRSEKTYKLIEEIHKPINIVALNSYLSRKPETSRRVLIGHQAKKMKTVKLIEKMDDYVAKFDQQAVHRRILNTGEKPSARIEKAQLQITKSVAEKEFKENMAEMFKGEANKCWNHYFNVIQKGILCSFCIDDSINTFFNITGQIIDFNFASCDEFIPHCLKMSIIQTRMSQFFRNVFILIINKLFKGSVLIDMVNNFTHIYGSEGSTDAVKMCEKQARCDSLCNKTIKFGDFSNEFIMGDIYLLDRALKFLKDLTSNSTNSTDGQDQTPITGQNGKAVLQRGDPSYWNLKTNDDAENLYSPGEDKINNKWIQNNIIKVVTKKRMDFDVKTTGKTEQELHGLYRKNKLKNLVIGNGGENDTYYKPITINRDCFEKISGEFKDVKPYQPTDEDCNKTKDLINETTKKFNMTIHCINLMNFKFKQQGIDLNNLAKFVNKEEMVYYNYSIDGSWLLRTWVVWLGLGMFLVDLLLF